ncbi:hypothetical protein ABPH35_10105 [Streptococcus sp. ZJ93]|uniref:hypothetical protein n=1 Tax=Streptococcus handemini TaxID=3161188 RepID=UPI0032EB8729
MIAEHSFVTHVAEKSQLLEVSLIADLYFVALFVADVIGDIRIGDIEQVKTSHDKLNTLNIKIVVD